MDLKNEQPAGSASCFFLLFLDAPHLVKHDTLPQLVEARITITLTKVLTQFNFNRSNHLAAQGRRSGKINKECVRSVDYLFISLFPENVSVIAKQN